MDKKDNDNLRLVAKYTTAALQMAAIIVFGGLPKKGKGLFGEHPYGEHGKVITLLGVTDEERDIASHFRDNFLSGKVGRDSGKDPMESGFTVK